MPNSHVSSNSLPLNKHRQIENQCVVAPVLDSIQLSSIAVPQNSAATDSFDLQHKQGIYGIKKTDGDSIIELSEWIIIECEYNSSPDKKTMHFVGYNAAKSEGRVSSAIVNFDKEKMVGITDSGRVYHLDGDNGRGGLEGRQVFRVWAKINDIKGSHEVELWR